VGWVGRLVGIAGFCNNDRMVARQTVKLPQEPLGSANVAEQTKVVAKQNHGIEFHGK
jgi:hypothetical protein